MMHERGKSDSAVGAMKPANKAERSAAELVEQRAGTNGNADLQSTRRTRDRESVSQALGRIRQVSPSGTRGRSRMHQGARTDLCGGRGTCRSPVFIREPTFAQRKPIESSGPETFVQSLRLGTRNLGGQATKQELPKHSSCLRAGASPRQAAWGGGQGGISRRN
jgi:hypothetical protein